MVAGGKYTGGYATGFPTPTSIPTETGCRTFIIPASSEFFSLIMGALDALRHDYNWYQSIDGIEIPDAVDAMAAILDASYGSGLSNTCAPSVEAPFWDDETDVGLNEDSDVQTWYGQITDVTAPASELDFVENLLVWSFTGLLAVGVSPGVAIAFNTVAKKFVIAQKAGDVGEIIRIVVDGADAATVDTTGHAGEIINTSVIADQTLDTHQVYIMKVS